MKRFGVFMVFAVLAAAKGEHVASKNNQQDTENVHQVKKLANLQTASTHEQKVQMAHAQEFRTNAIGNADNQDKRSQHFQVRNDQFLNQNQSPLHSFNQDPQQSQSLEERFRNQQSFSEPNQEILSYSQAHQEPQLRDLVKAPAFDNQKHAQDSYDNQAHQYLLEDRPEQYHDQTQLMSSGSPFNQDRAVSSTTGRFDQQNIPFSESRTQGQSQGPTSGVSPVGHQLYTSISANQEAFYHDSTQRIQDQDRFRSVGQPGILFGRPVEMKVSAFEKGALPIHLPRLSHQHSSSVLVSGLKNLPSLPALVYSSGATVPSGSQVLSYGQPWHQGGAYIRQHWQTPYARYVYSHFL